LQSLTLGRAKLLILTALVIYVVQSAGIYFSWWIYTVDVERLMLEMLVCIYHWES